MQYFDNSHHKLVHILGNCIFHKTKILEVAQKLNLPSNNLIFSHQSAFLPADLFMLRKNCSVKLHPSVSVFIIFIIFFISSFWGTMQIELMDVTHVHIKSMVHTHPHSYIDSVSTYVYIRVREQESFFTYF